MLLTEADVRGIWKDGKAPQVTTVEKKVVTKLRRSGEAEIWSSCGLRLLMRATPAQQQ